LLGPVGGETPLGVAVDPAPGAPDESRRHALSVKVELDALIEASRKKIDGASGTDLARDADSA